MLCLWERSRKLKSKSQKAEEIKLLQERLAGAKAVLFTNYRGLTVEDLSQMRGMLKESQVEYRVVKNTLARIAVEDTPVVSAKAQFTGPVGIAIGYDDPVLAVKKTLEYSKKNDKLVVNGGVVEGKFLELADLKNVAELPSRDIQLGMLAGAMAAPLTKMASLLNATVQNLGYALSALKDKKEE